MPPPSSSRRPCPFFFQYTNHTRKRCAVLLSGTLHAACELMKKQKAEVLGCLVVIELKDLRGAERLPVPVFSLLENWARVPVRTTLQQAFHRKYACIGYFFPILFFSIMSQLPDVCCNCSTDSGFIHLHIVDSVASLEQVYRRAFMVISEGWNPMPGHLPFCCP